jgi:hypothetical protein
LSQLGTSPLFTIKKAHESNLRLQIAQNLAYLCKVNKDSTWSRYLVAKFMVFILTHINEDLVPLSASQMV